jgi:acyl dehydratase
MTVSTESNQQRFVNLYFEDINIGQEIWTESHIVTEKDILTFAEVTRDRHPLHTDPEYCKKTEFGKPIAHGLFGLSLMEGLKAESRIYEQTSIGSLGWDEVRFLKPLFADETVHVTFKFMDKRLSRKPGRGVVTEKVKLLRQDKEILIEGLHITLLKCRTEENT